MNNYIPLVLYKPTRLPLLSVAPLYSNLWSLSYWLIMPSFKIIISDNSFWHKADLAIGTNDIIRGVKKRVLKLK